MAQIEWFVFLAAATFYAVSSVIYVISLIFKKEHWIKYGAASAVVGIIPHTAAVVLHWIASGHGPYLTMFEVLSSYAWISVAVFLIIGWRHDKVRFAGVLVMPVSFILIGIAATFTSPEVQPIPPSLRSYWLIAHIGFAKLAFGPILLATGLAILHLLKERQVDDRAGSFYDRIPSLGVLDDLSYQFTAAGFLFLTIMIATGAIWANQTWGRYWGWDPIETWALIAWLTYGIYLHIRVLRGWKGTKAAWLMIGALFILIFSLFGVGLVYGSIHSAYMTP